MPIKNGLILQTKNGDWKATLGNFVTIQKIGRKYYTVINGHSISISVIDALEMLSVGCYTLTFSDGTTLLLESSEKIPQDC